MTPSTHAAKCPAILKMYLPLGYFAQNLSPFILGVPFVAGNDISMALHFHVFAPGSQGDCALYAITHSFPFWVRVLVFVCFHMS
jgi:hypothetical protein